MMTKGEFLGVIAFIALVFAFFIVSKLIDQMACAS